MTDPRHPSDLDIKIFADGAELGGIREMAADPLIKGFSVVGELQLTTITSPKCYLTVMSEF